MSVEQGRCQESPDAGRPFQLSLFEDPRPPETPEEMLGRAFRQRLAGVVWTDNRLRIASVAPEAHGSARLILRLHRCFRQAPRPVLRAVAAWATGRRATRKAALAELRAFFERAAPRAQPSEPGPGRYFSRGRAFDLTEILAELNREYFGDRITAQISWGRDTPSRRRRRRTMLLGSYSYDQRLIRIHPRLDDPAIPRFVVAAVVHHEMVHAFLPNPGPALRRALHSQEFRRLERQYSHHEQAQSWFRDHLPKLLRRCGGGALLKH